MLWPNVEKYRDGDPLDAATLNDPIDQLIARTEYLKRVLDASASHTNVAIATATLSADGGAVPKLGQPVYRVPGGNAYAQAKATVGAVDESKWFWADQQAMAVGVVGSTPSGTSATVVLSGYISFGAGIPVADVIVDADPESGRYFLSATAGKLTAAPTGPIIYVCDCEIANGKVVSMLVSPQYRDTGESHIHRAFVLSGKPVGYAVKPSGATYYRAAGIVYDGYTKSGSAGPTNTVTVVPGGHWTYDGDVVYKLQITLIPGKTSGSSAWSDYQITWSSGGADGNDVTGALTDAPHLIVAPIGSHGLVVDVMRSGTVSPGSLSGKTWTVSMPDAARSWLNVWTATGGSSVVSGFRLNLGMYPEMARFVPPLPANAAELTAGGVGLRGLEFGSRKQWEIVEPDDFGGPWLMWYGAEVSASSVTTPFEWNATVSSQKARDIVLHVNRMRVGPTGFVTSLQAAPGSPLKVTSAQTGANAVQGALQVGLDVDFKSEAGNAEGHEVVKKIVGSTFVTGPVVERVVAGPGMSVDRQQGIVTVSASNAVYAGDFETIALRNAKQDVAGGVFPYTKLLKWETGSVTNVASGFTAKFRVPDHIPYNAGKGYYVVVSASVFGEADDDGATAAAFRLRSYVLADQACAAGVSFDPAEDGRDFGGGADGVATDYAPVVSVPFAEGYSAFDPVLVHGFGTVAGQGPGTLVLPDTDQRVRDDALWLGVASGTRMVVYPGYFVGISVERCGVTGSATPYVPAIGFLSLRWNLVAIQ